MKSGTWGREIDFPSVGFFIFFPCRIQNRLFPSQGSCFSSSISLTFFLCYVADDRVCYFCLAPDFTRDFIIRYFAGSRTKRVKRRKQEKKGIRHLCYRENRFLR